MVLVCTLKRARLCNPQVTNDNPSVVKYFSRSTQRGEVGQWGIPFSVKSIPFSVVQTELVPRLMVLPQPHPISRVAASGKLRS